MRGLGVTIRLLLFGCGINRFDNGYVQVISLVVPVYSMNNAPQL